MEHDRYSDSLLRRVLREVRTIAMVGASPDWNRPSYFAMKYLQIKGYRVIPVNPKAAGGEILGERVYASLKDIPEILGERVYASLKEVPDKVDMVDIFRASAAVPPIVEDAIAIGAKVVWMQIGVRNEEAARRAEEAGLTVVMNRCPKIEYGRLNRELSWGGVNSRIISSRRRLEARR
jgi:uncharacterized protein